MGNAVGCEKNGVLRELNSGPPAPKAGIIPLDQVPNAASASAVGCIVSQPEAQANSVIFAFSSVYIVAHALLFRMQLSDAGSEIPSHPEFIILSSAK